MRYNRNFIPIPAAIVAIPAVGINEFIDSADGLLKYKDTAGVVNPIFTSGGTTINGILLGEDVKTTTIPGVVAYADGDTYDLLNQVENTSNVPVTININALGAENGLTKVTVAIPPATLLAGRVYRFVYDVATVAFQLVGEVINGQAVQKLNYLFGEFTAAGTNIVLPAFVLPPGHITDAAALSPSVAFTGGAITAVVVDLDGPNINYLTDVDIFQAVDPTLGGLVTGVMDDASVPSPIIPSTYTLTMDSTTANLDALTQGDMDVWIRSSRLLF